MPTSREYHTRQFLGLGDSGVVPRPLCSILDAVPAGWQKGKHLRDAGLQTSARRDLLHQPQSFAPCGKAPAPSPLPQPYLGGGRGTPPGPPCVFT